MSWFDGFSCRIRRPFPRLKFSRRCNFCIASFIGSFGRHSKSKREAETASLCVVFTLILRITFLVEIVRQLTGNYIRHELNNLTKFPQVCPLDGFLVSQFLEALSPEIYGITRQVCPHTYVLPT